MRKIARQPAGRLMIYGVVSRDHCAMPEDKVTEDMVRGLLNDETWRTVLIRTKKDDPHWNFYVDRGRRLFWTTTHAQFSARLAAIAEERSLRSLCVLVSAEAAEEER